MFRPEGLPELGVGFIYWPALDDLVELDGQTIDVIEVEPQAFWLAPTSPTAPYRLDGRVFDRLRQLPQRKLVHGVGLPIGGTVLPESRHADAFAESINILGAAWASEHLSFSRVCNGSDNIDVGFLLPQIQSTEGITVAATNIDTLTAHIGVPFAFETGVNYLRPLSGELPDGTFFAAVALEADCGILLDLHNLWTNERNGRQPALQVIEELPLNRVVELHLAGGEEFEGYWVDAHSGLIPSEVMDLARRVVPLLPNLKAIIFEVMPEYVQVRKISRQQLADQFHRLHELWELRASNATYTGAPRLIWPKDHARLPSPHGWENALHVALKQNPQEQSGLHETLSDDPGIRVLRKLIASVRAGKVADTLTLSTRLLLLTLGEQRLKEAFEDFWESTPSEQMASVEASNFATYASRELAPEVPYLSDVLNLELATHKAYITNEAQIATLSVDPGPLLAALNEGRYPPMLTPGNYEISVMP